MGTVAVFWGLASPLLPLIDLSIIRMAAYPVFLITADSVTLPAWELTVLLTVIAGQPCPLPGFRDPLYSKSFDWFLALKN